MTSQDFPTNLHERLYLTIASALSEVLGRKDIFVIQDIFTSSLIEVFKISLDVSIDEKIFEQFISSCGSEPSERVVVEYVMDVTENEKTYTIVSYFLLFFLFTIYELIEENRKAELDDLFVKYRIDDELTEEVIEDFQMIANNY